MRRCRLAGSAARGALRLTAVAMALQMKAEEKGARSDSATRLVRVRMAGTRRLSQTAPALSLSAHSRHQAGFLRAASPASTARQDRAGAEARGRRRAAAAAAHAAAAAA